MPLSESQTRKLSAFMEAAIAILPRCTSGPDCCIAATKLTVEVARALHIRARPMAVKLVVMNPTFMRLYRAHGRGPEGEAEAARWSHEGAAVVLTDDTATSPGKWPWHLVALWWREVLIDLTLGNASRPAKGISLTPVAVTVPPYFLRGDRTAEVDVNGSVVTYQWRPDDHSYRNAPDWAAGRWKAPVAQIVRQMRAVLRRP